MFNFRYYAPHPRLRHLIRNYYLIDVDAPAGVSVSDRLITEFANFRICRGGDIRASVGGKAECAVPAISLAGPNSIPTVIRASSSFKLFGMGIQPLGWTALLDVPAADMADQIMPAAALLGEETVAKIHHVVDSVEDDDSLVEAVEAGIFCLLQQRSPRLSPIVRAVQDLIAVQPINRVNDLGVRVETSPRQLERLTKAAFGFSPKTTLRRARIRRTIQAMKGFVPVDWESQAEQDFADQSHLIHEFRRFTGVTPSVYQSQTNPLMDLGHAMQAALAGKMRQPQPADQRIKVLAHLDHKGAALPAIAQAA